MVLQPLLELVDDEQDFRGALPGRALANRCGGQLEPPRRGQIGKLAAQGGPERGFGSACGRLDVNRAHRTRKERKQARLDQ